MATINADINLTQVLLNEDKGTIETIINGLTKTTATAGNKIITETEHSTKENSLSNPTIDAQVLSSTIAGVRTWITPTGGGTGGQVDSVVAGTNVTIDSTDPVNPIVNATDTDTVYDDTTLAAAVALNTAKVTDLVHPLVETAVPVGAVFTDTDTVYDDTTLAAAVALNTAKVSYTDAALVATHTTDIAAKENSLSNPTIDAQVLSSTIAGVRTWITPTGGGTGGQVDSVVAGTNVTIDSTDPVNPIVNATDTDTVYDDTTLAAAVALNTAKVTDLVHPLVETAVPVGAVFTDTDTVYDDTTLAAAVALNTAKVSYTDAALVATHTTDIAAKEDSLPAVTVDGDILSSTIAGVRTWITPASGISELDDLSDADTTTVAPVAGDILEFDGTNWVPGTKTVALVDGLSGILASDVLTITIN